MRDSNYSDVNSIQLSSDDNSSKKEIEDSVVIEKQTQTIRKNYEEEIDLSNVNSSKFSIINSINIQNDSNKNSKIVKNANKIEINNNNNSYNSSQIQHIGNIKNVLNIEDKKLEIKEDKEKSEQKGYIIYEISKSDYNDNNKNKKKDILCYRRYSNFDTLYEALKLKYPQYIFPKLSQKKLSVKLKVIDEQEFLEKRRNELEFFINEIFSHKKIRNGQEITKFLFGGNFDEYYFKSIQKCFDYPETMKKIKGNKGLISKGVKGVTNFYNYLWGSKTKNNIERENSKIIFEIKEKLQKKIEKYNSTYEEIKTVYKILEKENKEKGFIANNLLFLKNERNIEDNINKKNFNELIDIYQGYNFKKNEEELKYFEKEVIYQLDFCILYLIGEDKAIERYKDFLNKYNDIINYNSGDNNKKITQEQIKIKNDIDNYEKILLEEMNNIEERTNKKYEDIINALIIYLRNTTKEYTELFKDSNFIKE